MDVMEMGTVMAACVSSVIFFNATDFQIFLELENFKSLLWRERESTP